MYVSLQAQLALTRHCMCIFAARYWTSTRTNAYWLSLLCNVRARVYLVWTCARVGEVHADGTGMRG